MYFETTPVHGQHLGHHYTSGQGAEGGFLLIVLKGRFGFKEPGGRDAPCKL